MEEPRDLQQDESDDPSGEKPIQLRRGLAVEAGAAQRLEPHLNRAQGLGGQRGTRHQQRHDVRMLQDHSPELDKERSDIVRRIPLVPLGNAHLPEDASDDPVQQGPLAGHVVVQRHRCNAELARQPADRQALRALPVEQPHRGAQDPAVREPARARLTQWDPSPPGCASHATRRCGRGPTAQIGSPIA